MEAAKVVDALAVVSASRAPTRGFMIDMRFRP